jgi:hypothetical protein
MIKGNIDFYFAVTILVIGIAGLISNTVIEYKRLSILENMKDCNCSIIEKEIRK